MKVYLYMIAFLFLYRLFRQKQFNKKSKKIFISISLLPVLLVLSLKSIKIGSDTSNYTRMFMSAKNGLIDVQYDRLEVGYKLFLNLISKVFTNPQWQYFLVALILVIAFGIFIYRYSKEPTIVIFLYITLGLFAFNLSGIRQSIAMAICLFSYKFIEEKKLLSFLLVIVFAFVFHRSAVFFIPAYFLAFRKISISNLLINFIGTFIIFIFAEPFILAFSGLFEIKYGIENAEGGFVFFLIVLIITILSLVYRKNILEMNPYNIIFINLNFISAVLWGMRLISRTAERPSFYYLFASILLLEQILVSIKDKNLRHFLLYTSIILSCVLFIYRLLGSTIYPYNFFFNY